MSSAEKEDLTPFDYDTLEKSIREAFTKYFPQLSLALDPSRYQVGGPFYACMHFGQTGAYAQVPQEFTLVPKVSYQTQLDIALLAPNAKDKKAPWKTLLKVIGKRIFPLLTTNDVRILDQKELLTHLKDYQIDREQDLMYVPFKVMLDCPGLKANVEGQLRSFFPETDISSWYEACKPKPVVLGPGRHFF